MSVIKIRSGLIRGKEEQDCTAFRGIPYAAPPVGELRWQHPQPVVPWEGVRDCFEFGSPCCQASGQMIPGGDPAQRGVFTEGSEDCLYLNVWTPDVNAQKLPVFVWIHGGAYCCGSGAGKSAVATSFVKRGIVYVSFNYRIGILGFFAHPELSAENEHHVSGNYAHYDQLAAIRWVKDNIAAFGGDPDNITVGGCSAGSGSSQVLACSPLAQGLLSASLPENDILRTMDEMEERGAEYMRLLGCKNLAELRALPYEKLIEHPEAQFRRKYHYGTTIGTCQDGYLLPEVYKKANELLHVHNIPRLIGNTNDEGSGHTPRMNRDVFIQNYGAIFGDKLEEFVALCQLTDQASVIQAANLSHLGLAAAKAFAAISAKAGNQPVYVYNFMRKSPEKGVAHHGLDTLYLMGVQNQEIKGSGPEDDQVAHTLQEYWCNFIKTGDPNGPGLPLWGSYSMEQRTVAYIDVDTVVATDEQAENPLLRFSREFLEHKLSEERATDCQ